MSKLKRLMHTDVWRIYLRDRKGDGLLEDTESFRCALKSPFVTYADPFLFEKDGKTWLLYEKQDLFTMRGILCARRLDAFDKEYPVLRKEHHLSYPDVFEANGFVWMIPETRNSGNVELYRFDSFPDKLSKVKDLKCLDAVDTTLLFTEDQSGLLFTYAHDQLQVFPFDADKEGMSVGEEALLVITDGGADHRPAGHFIKRDDKVIRPAQYCKDFYGQGLVFYKVLSASVGGYAEEPLKTVYGSDIFPGNRHIIGVHTYNETDRFEVVDLKYRYSGPAAFLYNVFLRVIWKIRSLFRK